MIKPYVPGDLRPIESLDALAESLQVEQVRVRGRLLNEAETRQPERPLRESETWIKAASSIVSRLDKCKAELEKIRKELVAGVDPVVDAGRYYTQVAQASNLLDQIATSISSQVRAETEMDESAGRLLP